ncbi:MAG: MmgE/PrpD family protein [Polaromonas sp.]|nr:MmgE/PrpD family protein [Polaromonas sp.]
MNAIVPAPEALAGDEWRRLCDWAANVRLTDIPPAILERAARVVADNTACAIGAGSEPALLAILRSGSSAQTGERPGVGESTVFAPACWKTGRAEAAQLNAIRANWCQFDEGHRSVMCHAGLYTVHTALAEAEATGQSMTDVLRAVVVAYEITCRLALAWRFGQAAPHPHAVWSAMGSCAALAVLRALPAQSFRQALAMAAGCARAAPFAQMAQGDPVANAWVGWGVADGFRCADLAGDGVPTTDSAPVQVFEGLLGASYTTGVLAEGLGQHWALAGNYHKPLACAGQAMAAVEALLSLRQIVAATSRTPVPVSITAEVHAAALQLGNPSPATSLGARFSIPHLLAHAWLHGTRGLQAAGDHDSAARALDNLGLDDEAVTRLRQRVRLVERQPHSPAPHDRAATVRLVFADGHEAVQTCLSAFGGPDRPMDRAAVLQKSRALAGGQWPAFYDWLESCGDAAALAAAPTPGDLLTD